METQKLFIVLNYNNKNMKKAFTLLEVTISITILTIMMLFLYKVLDQTKISNNKLTNKQNELLVENRLNKIFTEDILESIGKVTITQDKNENSIVTFKTKNTYHNPFFKYVIYLVGQNNTLFRIESNISFEKLKESNFDNDNLFFVDELKKELDLFKAYSDKDEVMLIINKNFFKISL